MQVIKPDLNTFNRVLSDPRAIRNVCILAHVDHGKTTLADSLLSTNGLISRRLAGKVRYLDDRRDEQERGITMKSSAVSLHYVFSHSEETSVKEIVLNVIDTPGHVDFSSEVVAAIRISDGALIVVDLVEGVCVQTREAIRLAHDEHVKMILVLNKMDRLIVELHKTVEEIFQCVLRVIEDCNATIAELRQYDVDDVNDETLEDESFFSPGKGNVIFASASDGWGVVTKQISKMFVNIVVDEDVDSLNEKIWNFDYYVDSSTKKVVSGAIEKKKENLFVQLCLKTIYFVYYTFIVRMKRDEIEVVLKKLKIQNITRDMYHNDPRIQVRAILQAWSPLAETVMLQCRDVLPSPMDISEQRLRRLIGDHRFYGNNESIQCAEQMMRQFKDKSIETESEAALIAYVSKLFAVNRKNLSQNRPKICLPRKIGDKDNKIETEDEKTQVTNGDVQTSTVAIVGLTRIFSGTLVKGSKFYFLDSSYNPFGGAQLAELELKEIYLPLGRELMLVESVPFGSICAIGNLDESIVRSGTLSSTPRCFPITDRIALDHSEPIVRNTIEPVNANDLPKLRDGLRLLTQSDPCVQVVIQETGELVLLTAGDVHLAKCLEDLNSQFIDFDIKVSKPTVSFRETLVTPFDSHERFNYSCINRAEVNIPEFGLRARIFALPLPHEIVRFVKTNFQLLRLIEDQRCGASEDIADPSLAQRTQYLVSQLKERMKKVFEKVDTSSDNFWSDMWSKIWSVGKMNDNINLLFNVTSDCVCDIFTRMEENDARAAFERCLIAGFEMCCRAGPICEEPLVNCGFFVEEFYSERCLESVRESKLQILANIPLAMKAGFRKALDEQYRRLVEPIFNADIQVNTSILGKVYSVLGKRQGKVLEAIGMDENEKTFLVKAQIPAVESNGFANEIRKTTSGQANPNLRFSHYEIVEGDPYRGPSGTEGQDDSDDEGCLESAIRAHKLMTDVRRRKGLPVDDQVVVHAEKQRTLNKKK